MLLHQQRCRRSRGNYRYQEAEEGESSNSLKIWTECKVLNSLVRDAGTNFGRQRVRHHYVPVLLKECVVKVVNKSGDENCSQDNLCLRTKSNTQKYLGSWELRHLVQFLETEIKIADVRLWPNSIRESQIGRTRNYKDEQYKQTKNHIRRTFWVRRPRRKVMKKAIASCMRQILSNSLQTSTWHSKEYEGEVYTLKDYDGVCTNALIQMEIFFGDEPEPRLKIPHTGIIDNQNKSMPRETEKH